MIKKIKHTFFLLVLVVILNACNNQNNDFSIDSSNGKLKVEINNEKGKVTYALFKDGKELIHQSEISILPNVKAEITSSYLSSENNTWKPVWGQFSEIKNQYNELVLDVLLESVKAKLYVRIFNHGVGLDMN